jgi:diguanylate cyclase (GGDEF)-like protein
VFGATTRVPRPVLLVLVYGIFLVIVGVTATAQTFMVSANFSQTTMQSIVGTDAALVRSFVNANVAPADLDVETMTPARRVELEGMLALLVARTEIVHLELRLPDGRVVAADQPGAAGLRAATSPDFDAALAGDVAASLDKQATSEIVGSSVQAADVLREYFPLKADGRVQAVVGVWRDAAPVLQQLDALRRDIVLTTLSAALVAAFVLWMVFRSAQGRITRQTAALVEATRRDPLTGLLNHGALVGEVAVAIEQAHADGGAIGVALVDLDGFRLLNETYGHDAGDAALLSVVEALAMEIPDSIARGRYGPDEFLLIAGAADVAALGAGLERLRARLVDVALQFESSERLPITVSVGVCTYPEHATSVTELLTVAATTLQEAKASGGDAVRYADPDGADTGETRTFDVFQGLILAVDTKDRYTKRHSEDVARYGVFLARRLGLDDEDIHTIHLAGLLHDVGKIGIPDYILRKPGALTNEEYQVVQQHVALGDTIVRDLPNVDLIRAGVRHHHERWDGKGYLHRLEGEQIPLVARILAVGDTFSAMTTTRPYRKALDLQEALRRLEDAAGTQLDEQLVVSFVEGMSTDASAPLPGRDLGPTLWTPRAQVA